MQRRKFSREFKLEAVILVRDRGVRIAKAAPDLDLHINVLRKWVSDHVADPGVAFPGHGQMQPEQLEIERLRRENTELKAERDILERFPFNLARIHQIGSSSLRSRLKMRVPSSPPSGEALATAAIQLAAQSTGQSKFT